MTLSDRVEKMPVVGALWHFAETRPRFAAWIVLSLGIVILLLIEARDVGLLIGQWAALIIASIVVAGLCIWIISWEDKDETEAEVGGAGSAKTMNAVVQPATTTPAAPVETVLPSDQPVTNQPT